MKFFVKKAAVAFILFVGTSNHLLAQRGKTNYEFGMNLGFMVYQGDLSQGPIGSMRTQKPFVELHATRLIGDRFSIRANFAAGKLKADDALYKKPEFKRHRNFNFTSPVYEISARVLWDPTGSNYAIRGIGPYLFVGAGLAVLDIKRDWSNIDKDYFVIGTPVLDGLPADSAQTLPSAIGVFPVGGGIKYFLSPNWALSAEVAYRFTSTDYLDGFSKTSPTTYKDTYFTYGVGIIYRPGKRDPLDCATPRY